MNKQEINKYLTEKVFNECWHEKSGSTKFNPFTGSESYKCKLCDEYFFYLVG